MWLCCGRAGYKIGLLHTTVTVLGEKAALVHQHKHVHEQEVEHHGERTCMNRGSAI